MTPRIERLIGRDFEADFDAFLIVDEINVRYLTGFTGDSTWLVVDRAGKATMLSDGRYETQLSEECGELPRVIRPPGQLMPELLAEFVGDAKLKAIAFEATHVHVATMKTWSEAMPDVTWLETSGVVEDLRQIKDADELAAIRRAIEIAQRAYRSVTAKLSPEMTEIDLFYDLEATMRSLGAEGVSFHPIVGAEPSGALPHYRPRKVALGDCRTLLIDWGAKVDGYCSDLTRTLHRPGSSSPTSARFDAAYQAVLDAQNAAIERIADGVETVDVDRAAREVLENAGLGEAFRHGLGHGFGLQIHEDPRMGPSSKAKLRSGMVVTVEPGVYFENEFGIRIEDDILVTDNGYELLSDLPKGLDDCPLVM
ncbi:M24 family metallopeptidase [Neorhodopirellula pilleata]|uniref:Putative peptidase n=1 Tax=Neorhodopirellula pilleata TaxID=2714738 RepID=A0A5C6ABU7_9BACT|nr:Xaa-Pro peptidase family protein [Neorhodopirellula pilleata]TWT97494.1 putative peptidase [Neorhodopirellula pilleata]